MKSKKTHTEKIHIGQIIQEKVNKSGLTITEFAEKINLSRPAVYQMFNKQSIDCELLSRISILLGENLFEILYKEVEQIQQKTHPEEHFVKEKSAIYHTPNTNQLILNKLDHIHKDLVSIKDILLNILEIKTEKA